MGRTIFKKFKIDFEETDTSMPEHKDMRTKFFAISRRPGEFPQIFIRTGAEGAYEYEFVGCYTEIDGMNEVNQMLRDQPELLASKPETKTIDNVQQQQQHTPHTHTSRPPPPPFTLHHHHTTRTHTT